MIDVNADGDPQAVGRKDKENKFIRLDLTTWKKHITTSALAARTYIIRYSDICIYEPQNIRYKYEMYLLRGIR